MRILTLTLAVALSLSGRLVAQTDPIITTWQLNTTGVTGFNNLPANVQQVQYSDSSVYTTASGIPSYTIGPWPGQPTQGPTAQNFTFKFPRHPRRSAGTATHVGGGHVGIWVNGVSIFNAQDANSYNNQRVWFQDAVLNEGQGFDGCNGHPTPMDEYHNHLNPKCLYNDHDSSAHSPIIGYAFDGFPVYGTYAYTNADGTGAIKSMKSGFRLRTMAQRHTRPDGSTLQPNQYGPDVSTQYPLGKYLFDYEYVPGLGDLDPNNGRFCVTPEYPQGTYAYFVTLNSFYEGTYPYTLGLDYYGIVPNGNTGGPNTGHNTPTEPVTTYVVTANRASVSMGLTLTPNPSANHIDLRVKAAYADKLEAWLCTPLGARITQPVRLKVDGTQSFDVSGLANGVYFLWVQGASVATSERVVVAR